MSENQTQTAATSVIPTALPVGTPVITCPGGGSGTGKVEVDITNPNPATHFMNENPKCYKKEGGGYRYLSDMTLDTGDTYECEIFDVDFPSGTHEVRVEVVWTVNYELLQSADSAPTTCP